MEEGEPGPTFVRSHECRNSDVILEIHQDPDGVWSAGCGATVWDSALVLSALLEQSPAEVEGKRVLEIGAGERLIHVQCCLG